MLTVEVDPICLEESSTPMDSQQVAIMFANIQTKLEALTQIMNQNQDKLGREETRLENCNEYEGKRGLLTPCQNDRYLTSTRLDVPIFYYCHDYSNHSNLQIFLDCL